MAACVDDFGCEAGEVCYKNVSWSDESGFCACSTWYGWEGEDCSEFSANTWILLLSAGFQVLLCAIFGTIGLYDTLRMILVFRSNLKLNATLITLASVSIALGSLGTARGLQMLSAIFPESLKEDSIGNDDKFTLFSLIARPFLFLASVFSVIAALNVSVMWLELAFRAKNMKTRMIQGITYYRRVVYIFEACFTIAMAVTAALGRFDLTGAVALPFILLLVITVFRGRRKMLGVLKDALEIKTGGSTDWKNLSSNARKEKSAAQRTWRTMIHIHRVSLHVLCGLFVGVLAALGYFLLSTLNGGWKEYSPQGSVSWVMVVNEVWNFSVLYTDVAILVYAHRSSRKLIRRTQGVEQSGSLSENEPASKGDSSFMQSNYVAGNLASYQPRDVAAPSDASI